MGDKTLFRRWLDSSGYSVRQIAEACGVSRTAVYNWTSGDSAPSLQHLAVLHKLSHGAVQPWFWIEEPNDDNR